MKAEQVDKALHQKFFIEGKRLVFWHDAEGEFAEYVSGVLGGDLVGELAGVQVLDVEQLGGLSAKLRLEREDPTGKYLVYSKGERPVADQDWLLDIRLYSAQFMWRPCPRCGSQTRVVLWELEGPGGDSNTIWLVCDGEEPCQLDSKPLRWSRPVTFERDWEDL